MSFVIFTAILFLVLWIWIAYEYTTAISLTPEEELLLEEETASPSSYAGVQEAR